MGIRVIVATAVSAAVALGLVGAALMGPDGVGRHDQLEAELAEARKTNASLRAENDRLAAERWALRHDPVYIDSVIRDDLGYIRDDEVIVELSPLAVDPNAPQDRP